LKSSKIFQDLRKKFEVFLIHKPLDYHGSDDKEWDARIVAQWQEAIGKERVIPLPDPNGVVDAILGILSAEIYSDVDQYDVDMKNRDQDPSRRKMISSGIRDYYNSRALVPVDGQIAHKQSKGADRRGKTQRI
jgi:hypothetical protein